MQIRLTTLSDLDAVMQIYNDAREFMYNNGNPTQWINGYPSEDIIVSDINSGHNYIILNEENEIAGVFTFIIGTDPTYSIIKYGNWLNDQPYGVIHRIASSGKCKGIAKICFDWCFAQIQNIRIDTHINNIPMQKSILNYGFRKCGIIYTHNGTERIAFQLTK